MHTHTNKSMEDHRVVMARVLHTYSQLVEQARTVPAHNRVVHDQLHGERRVLRKQFIAADRGYRDCMKQDNATSDLKDLRRQLRMLDDDYKAITEMILEETADNERGALFGDHVHEDSVKIDIRHAGNDELLSAAIPESKATTKSLRDGLQLLVQTEEVRTYVCTWFT